MSRLTALLTITTLLLTAAPITSPSATATQDVDASGYVVYEAHDFRTYRFVTPDRTVSCELYETTGPTPWACGARRHTWRVPTLAASDLGQGAAKDAIGPEASGGRFTVRPYSSPDPQVQLPTKVLPRGSRIRMDGLTCTVSRRSGTDSVRCADSGGSTVTISRKRLTYAPGH